ncbi:MAG TPA: homogentisate 1,2-dioxygenase, partial [Thermoanaerobaculia bacterium]|nr:homogentisate 1,2-dioxygenase [Thermoanaerobaculia bacterium]
MTFYARMGQIPHKRHTQFRRPDGSLYHEEVMGIHGFAGIQSILYHLRPPTRVQEVGAVPADGYSTPDYEDGGPLRHRHLRTAAVPAGGDAVEGRVPILGNQDVVLSLVRPTKAMDYWYRFAHGDEVLFVHDGTGVLECQYGVLHYRPGDYLVLPTGVLWRLVPDEGVEQRLLVIEAHGHIEPP